MPEMPEKAPRHFEPSEIVRFMNEYEDALPKLGPIILQLGTRMKQMRDAGIPDRATYEKIRTVVVRSLGRMTDLRQRLNDIMFQRTNASPGTVREAQRISIDHEKEFDFAEDAFNQVLIADARWHDELAQKGRYGRRATDYGPLEGERTVPMELYENRIRDQFFPEAGALEEAFEQYALPKLTQEKLEKFHEGLTDLYTRLTKLDAETPGFQNSKERTAFIYLIKQLKERYPLSSMPPAPVPKHEPPLAPTPAPTSAPPPVPAFTTMPTPAPTVPLHAAQLQSVLETQKRVKGEYATVSHLMSDERRRHFRTRIAQLSATVDALSEQAWRAATVRPAFPPSPPPPEPPLLDPAAMRERVQLSMTRAVLAAYPISDAVMAGVRRRRGVFGALGDIFRMK
ncbi:MAG TPA: hypothetical protein VJ553_04485 [Candidatus Paceibacterota bacterium]|nr:hypothetical protein [Candidatus Paceibacterota bacterium]